MGVHSLDSGTYQNDDKAVDGQSPMHDMAPFKAPFIKLKHLSLGDVRLLLGSVIPG